MWPPSGSVGRGGRQILRFELLSVSEVMAYYAFFLKKIKKYQVTCVKEEGDRPNTLQITLDGGNHNFLSKWLTQNNRPLLGKGHEGLLPTLPTSRPRPPPHPQAYVWRLSPGSAGIRSRYLIPHVPTGVTWLEFFQPFHFTSASCKPQIRTSCGCSNCLNSDPLFAAATKSQIMAMRMPAFSLPNYSEPQFTSWPAFTFQHLS